jgi:flagellar basal-body rod modification protein FlgD
MTTATTATTVTTPSAAVSAATASSAAPVAQAANTQALASLGSNLNDFLSLLMTQLQNQDPTQPLDTSQFTTQLVQFASVEQQVNANTSLTSLIQLTQGGQMLQAGALVGKQVEAQSSTLALSNSTATLDLHPATSGPVTVSISSTSGITLQTQQVQASASGTSWSWNGTTNTGQSLPDGTYDVAVTDANGAAVPFGVVGTVANVQKSGSDVMVGLNSGQQVSLSSIQSTN